MWNGHGHTYNALQKKSLQLIDTATLTETSDYFEFVTGIRIFLASSVHKFSLILIYFRYLVTSVQEAVDSALWKLTRNLSRLILWSLLTLQRLSVAGVWTTLSSPLLTEMVGCIWTNTGNLFINLLIWETPISAFMNPPFSWVTVTTEQTECNSWKFWLI